MNQQSILDMSNSTQNIFESISNTLTSLVRSALKVVQTLIEFVFKLLNFVLDFAVFLKESEFFRDNYRIILIFVAIAYGHDLILINEEILVTFCFLAALFFLYSNMGDAITEALNERSEGIRKELSTFLLLKQENLNELYKSEESFLYTTQNLGILQKYCEQHFVHLDENQQKALVGLVAQNLHAKIEALHVIKKSLQPTLHAQMNLSFREAVLEDFKNVDTSQSISECLEQVKKLSKQG
jgi:hypothetical protein